MRTDRVGPVGPGPHPIVRSLSLLQVPCSWMMLAAAVAISPLHLAAPRCLSSTLWVARAAVHFLWFPPKEVRSNKMYSLCARTTVMCGHHIGFLRIEFPLIP